MNVGALQSMIGMNRISAGNMQKGNPDTTKFGAIFSGISSNASDGKLTVDKEVQTDQISELFKASTSEELEGVINSILGEGFSAADSSNPVSIDELAQAMSLNSEVILKNLQLLLEKSGLTKVDLEELTIATDMWTILSLIDEAGIRLFDNLNEALEKPTTRNEATQLLAFIKTLELTAPKSELLISMEQKIDSLRHMLTNAAGQFEQRMSAVGKQEQMPFNQQKIDFRIVLETNPKASTNSDGSGQKHADNTSHSNIAHATVTTVRAELPVQQSESNPANRSESFMKEMQMLLKRSNFGQVGGTNRMLIKLYPEHLGQIRIELLETNGIMTARILASTAFAKGMLDSQLHQLKHAFNQQNLQVERIDITQTIQESQRSEREQSFNEQFKREQQTDDKKEKNSSDEERSFEEFMIELEV